MSNRLIDLNQDTYFLANKAIAELQDLKIPFFVASTKRTAEEQYAYWLQGRESLETVNDTRLAIGMRAISERENLYTITNCDGVRSKSNHQSGDALDIVPLEGERAVWPKPYDKRWKQIADVMKNHGFIWGGDWKDFPDYPHYQRKV